MFLAWARLHQKSGIWERLPWEQCVKTHLQDLLIDIPVPYRGSYCVTSGHKVNLDPKRNSCQIKKFGKNLMQLLDIQCRQTTSLEKTMQSW